MVSKASELLPEPERPVITTSLSRGISRLTFLRLCSRAPAILIYFEAIIFSGTRSCTKTGSYGTFPHADKQCIVSRKWRRFQTGLWESVGCEPGVLRGAGKKLEKYQPPTGRILSEGYEP